MILNIFIWGGVVTWLTFVSASAFANVYFKRKANTSASTSISEAFKAQGESLGRIEKHLQGKEQHARLMEPKEATRVYAVLIQRNFEEMSAIVTREVGTGWMILISAFADVLGWKPQAQPQTTETKAAMVETPIANFIHDLEYSRDRLADSPAQKEAVDEIIKKLKSQHYGNSRSGSAA